MKATFTYTLPAAWSLYLLLGDTVFTKPSEVAHAESFLMLHGLPKPVSSSLPYWSSNNDANTGHVSVCNYTFEETIKPCKN